MDSYAGWKIGELAVLKEGLRQKVNALELCHGCERICECEEGTVNGAQRVWLCATCWRESRVKVECVVGTSWWRSSRSEAIYSALVAATQASVASLSSSASIVWQGESGI